MRINARYLGLAPYEFLAARHHLISRCWHAANRYGRGGGIAGAFDQVWRWGWYHPGCYGPLSVDNIVIWTGP